MHPPDHPTLFCLHFLGGSAATWAGVVRHLAGSFRCVAIDLPGFGDAAATPGYTVTAMADRVADLIRAQAPRRWALAGHSMGAKVAAVLARRAEDGEPGLGGLSQLVLLAGSPPGPEPMDESQRQTMLSWFAGDPAECEAQAQGYIDGNIGAALDRAANAQAVGDVLRLERAAWLAWLQHGSREDWSARVGVLRTPAMILAGADDAALGPGAQRDRMAPHFLHARLESLPDTGHLLPLERPEQVARLIVEHAATIGQARAVDRAPAIADAYLALIRSDRVGARTREALLERARPDHPDYRPAAMTLVQLDLLRAVIDRVLPQPPAARIDLAARIDALLGSGVGDGWRYALLPPDPEAYRAALRTLDASAHAAHGCGFAALDGDRQDDMLRRVAADGLGSPSGPGLLDAPQMRLWFEELRSDATRLYVAHPATLARMGYGGIAYGGDEPRKPGFVRIGAGEREAWEPQAAPDAAS